MSRRNWSCNCLCRLNYLQRIQETLSSAPKLDLKFSRGRFDFWSELTRTLMLLQRDILHSIMQILQVLTLIDDQVTQRRQAVIAHNVEDWQLDLDFLDQPVANLDRHERSRSRATKRAQYSSSSIAFAGCCLAWDFSTEASQSFLLLIKLTWRFSRPVVRNSRRRA